MAVTPGARRPSKRTRMRFGFAWRSVCVASTCATSLEPMPKASAPRPPWVQVWLSGQTSGHAGQRETELRGRDMQDALALVVEIEQPHAGGGGATAHLAQQAAAGRVGVGGAARRAGDGVVRHREGEVGIVHRIAALGDAGEAGPAFEIVQQVTVDRQQAHVAAELGHDVLRPDLVEQRARGHDPPRS